MTNALQPSIHAESALTWLPDFVADVVAFDSTPDEPARSAIEPAPFDQPTFRSARMVDGRNRIDMGTLATQSQGEGGHA